MLLCRLVEGKHSLNHLLFHLEMKKVQMTELLRVRLGFDLDW